MDHSDDWKRTDRLHAPSGKGDPFAAAVRATRMPMIITDPRQHDNPIVFANEAFLRLTGYGLEEVLGRNCRFLQGPETNREDVAKVREAIEKVEDISIDLLNYRRDGSSFWNALYMSPVIDESGQLLYFFASQLDVSDRKFAELRVRAEKERIEDAVKLRTRELHEALEARTILLHEVDHRVKNNLQLISALVSIEARHAGGERQALATLEDRVAALSTVYRRLYQDVDVERFDVGAFVTDLVEETRVGLGAADVDVELDIEPVRAAAVHAAALALFLSEAVTMALRSNAPARQPVRISLKALDDGGGRYRLCIEDDGPTGADEARAREMIEMMARQLRTRPEWRRLPDGRRELCADLPVERFDGDRADPAAAVPA